MASVNTTVSVQAFNGLEHGMVGACAHTTEWEGFIERLARLFEAKTSLPVEDTCAS